MDLMEIARRSGMPPRRLRYAIYHTVVPGIEKVDVGRGSVRRFTPYEGFCIALAAQLLDAGIKRDVVRAAIRVLSASFGWQTPLEAVPLYRAVAGRGRSPTEVQIADGRHFRVRAGAAPPLKALDTGWLCDDGSGHGGAGGHFEPAVVVAANAGPLVVTRGLGSHGSRLGGELVRKCQSGRQDLNLRHCRFPTVRPTCASPLLGHAGTSGDRWLRDAAPCGGFVAFALVQRGDMLGRTGLEVSRNA